MVTSKYLDPPNNNFKTTLNLTKICECSQLNYNMVQIGTTYSDRGHFTRAPSAAVLDYGKQREFLRAITWLQGCCVVWMCSNYSHCMCEIHPISMQTCGSRKLAFRQKVPYVRIWSIKINQTKKKKPTKPQCKTVNLAKDWFGGSYTSAEVRHIGFQIDLCLGSKCWYS